MLGPPLFHLLLPGLTYVTLTINLIPDEVDPSHTYIGLRFFFWKFRRPEALKSPPIYIRIYIGVNLHFSPLLQLECVGLAKLPFIFGRGLGLTASSGVMVRC